MEKTTKNLLITSGVIVSLLAVFAVSENTGFPKDTSTSPLTVTPQITRAIEAPLDPARASISGMLDDILVTRESIDTKEVSKEAFALAVVNATRLAVPAEMMHAEAVIALLGVSGLMASAVYENPKLDKESLIDSMLKFTS